MTPTEEYIQLHDKTVHLKLCIADYERQIKSMNTQMLKIKDHLLKEFEEDGVLPDRGLTVRKSPPKIIVTDEDLLPDRFFKTRRELDKKGLNDFIKENGLLDGTAQTNGGYTIAIERCKK